jgi:predicted transcriptional regulator
MNTTNHKAKKSEHLTIKITPKLKTALTSFAARQNRSRSWVVTKFIEAGLKRAG